MTKHYLVYAGPAWWGKNCYDYKGISIEEAKQKAIKQACIDYSVEDLDEDDEDYPYVALLLTSDSPITQEENELLRPPFGNKKEP
jgi:hypothetical protein